MDFAVKCFGSLKVPILKGVVQKPSPEASYAGLSLINRLLRLLCSQHPAQHQLPLSEPEVGTIAISGLVQDRTVAQRFRKLCISSLPDLEELFAMGRPEYWSSLYLFSPRLPKQDNF